MADNIHDNEGFPAEGAASDQAQMRERRAFLKRAAMIGIPVAVATVHSRTAWAQTKTASCKASKGPSGCNNRF